MPKVKCDGCGAQFSGDTVPESGEFTCGGCGAVVKVRAQPVMKIDPHARHGREAARNDPVKRKAKSRMAAAKMGSTAMYCGIAGVLFFFFSSFAALISGLIAIVCGVWGLIWLSTVGPGRTEGEDLYPIERVAGRMAVRGKREAFIGLLAGLAVIGSTVAVIAASR